MYKIALTWELPGSGPARRYHSTGREEHGQGTAAGAGVNVLVVAAHPDDEVLGCGGTIARHSAAGDEVSILIVAEGATSRDAAGDATARVAALSGLRVAATDAAAVLGARPPRLGDLPDNRLDTVAMLDVVKVVEEAMRRESPTVVYTHHGGDLNVDHRVVFKAVLTATRPLPDSSVRAVYAFETLSSTEWSVPAIGPPFVPNHFVDISDHLKHKHEALRCYASEMRLFPHSRSHEAVEALARLRGAGSGLAAAEAFAVVREIVTG